MDVMPKPLPVDPAQVAGLSAKLLRSHYDNNYLGAVSKLNTIRKQIENTDREPVPGFALVGAKREELLAANSVFLHEAYFDALGGNGAIPQGGLSVALERDFGSEDNWRAEFRALAQAMGGGSGWAILAWSQREARMVNHWAGDHTQLLAGASTLLALDMYEHAYHLDFGANASAYVDAFVAQIRWDAIASAYARTMAAASSLLQILPPEAAAQNDAVILDVRRRSVVELAHEKIPKSEWRDPTASAQWLSEFDQAQSVIVYCVHGHEISQNIALALRARGIPAWYLAGGIAGWKSANLPIS
ncbi:superoxide dismutase [Achromobacter xylosoxidans]|uniref:Fe-Mn family superoxide dismutase n=2 Tax=Achromobacter TaxID=222 RepID=UPI000D4536C4|nr:Fe-Mn family superoxide dismutase [Achromobacter aegrifaciens]MDQ1758232.1 Fe-Mn family superoxide dismutase [Achromobacter aegrifaciens]PTN52800.1 superoxide dismutase [Achromobacter xylosoxidans]